MIILKDSLWAQVSPDKKAILCFLCIERRLGRPLTFRDLRDCNITREMALGALMAQREGLQIAEEDIPKLVKGSDFTVVKAFYENCPVEQV